MKSWHVLTVLLAIVSPSALDRPISAADESLSAANPDGLRVVSVESRDGGETAYRVTSPWQRGKTVIRVLLPEGITPDERLRVLYVLPVGGGEGTRWGDGLSEIRKSGVHNLHRLICVMPTFSALPWYADHPTDSESQQEKYLLSGVLP